MEMNNTIEVNTSEVKKEDISSEDIVESIAAENGGRILSIDNPDDENNDLRDSVDDETVTTDPEIKPEIISPALTKEDIKDLNFVELQRLIRVNQKNIDSLEDAKVMIDAMQNMYESAKDILNVANEFKKGHEVSEEGEIDYSDLIKLPKEFKVNYEANKPILEANIKLVEEFTREKYGKSPKTSSFYSSQLMEALQHQLDHILNLPDEDKKFTIPKENLPEKEKNAVRSLKNSMNAVSDRPTMNYIFNHCTTTGALINTWNNVKKNYEAADKMIRKYCMESMRFNIVEFNAVVKFFTIYAGSTFISRMMLYQIARIIKNGKHDGTDMYGRLFLLNVSDYTFKRFDYDENRLDEVMKTISMVYNNYAILPKGNSAVKAYKKLPIYKKDIALDKEMQENLQKAISEVEKNRKENTNG